jgi:putative ABC transport system ATP-binding protein
MTANPSAPPLQAVDLRRTFRQGNSEIAAVAGVSFAASAGELVVIMGPSGSGKSTLLHLLGALDKPDSGKVMLEGREISSLPDRELAIVRRRRLGFLLQFFSLLPTMTVLENVAFPLLLDGAADAHDRARATLRAVGLQSRLDHRPAQLSGGEQQRAALARALVAKPAVVLADEPTGSLDAASSLEILDLLRQTAHSGQTIVIVTHDPAAAAYAQRVVHLVDGRLEDAHDGRLLAVAGSAPSGAQAGHARHG